MFKSTNANTFNQLKSNILIKLHRGSHKGESSGPETICRFLGPILAFIEPLLTNVVEGTQKLGCSKFKKFHS